MFQSFLRWAAISWSSSHRRGGYCGTLRTDAQFPPRRTMPNSPGFTPSGEVVLIDYEGTIHWWDPNTGRLRTPSSRRIYRTSRTAVSPDGFTLATVDPTSGKLHLWSAETLELQEELSGHQTGVTSLVFAPDGKTLASAGFDRTLALWDVATGEELLRFEGFPGEVCQPCFSHDGRAFAALSRPPDANPEVFLWRTTEIEPPVPVLGQGMIPPR